MEKILRKIYDLADKYFNHADELEIPLKEEIGISTGRRSPKTIEEKIAFSYGLASGFTRAAQIIELYYKTEYDKG